MATPLHGTRAHLVREAEDEAREAQALVEALEDRVRDGDDKVTPEELESASKLSRFAQLRVEAARKKAEAARRADAAAQMDAAADAVVAFLDRVPELDALEQKVVDALTELVHACEKQRVEGRKLGRAIDGAAAVAAEFGVPDAWAPNRRVRVRGSDRTLLAVKGDQRLQWSAEKVNASQSLRRVLHAAGLRTPGSISVVPDDRY